MTASEREALRSLSYISGSAPERQVFTEADDLKNLVTIDRDLHRADELFRENRTTEGVRMLRSVISRRPDTADAYISLAYSEWESGQWPAAIATLEAGLAAGAPDRDLRIRLGIYLAESGTNLSKAIALLESLPDTDVEGLNALGLAYGRAGRYRDAIAVFQKILTLDATSGLAHQNIAAILLEEAGRPSGDRGAKLREAEQFARRAVDLDPSLAKGFTTLGVILAQTNRKPDAIDSCKRAVQLDPNEFDALYNLIVLLADAGRIGEARTYGEQYVRTAPPQLDGDVEAIRQLLRR
jgi:tetratricopeptide (TPR) repeat protein